MVKLEKLENNAKIAIEHLNSVINTVNRNSSREKIDTKTGHELRKDTGRVKRELGKIRKNLHKLSQDSAFSNLEREREDLSIEFTRFRDSMENSEHTNFKKKVAVYLPILRRLLQWLQKVETTARVKKSAR